MSSNWERVRLRMETSKIEDDSRISTHILDTTAGKAAANVKVSISLMVDNNWQPLNEDNTNADGRIENLLGEFKVQNGIYKLHFDVGSYFQNQQTDTFYPFIEIVVKCVQGQHYHVPLLLNPFGYTTYRGT